MGKIRSGGEPVYGVVSVNLRDLVSYLVLLNNSRHVKDLEAYNQFVD